ncbi:MAG: efflux RND transporter permease subunit [Candidatus Endonucleobacter sp. (ex Gigantidas childressi)]|nr:efflux RND transporter permease subunit [Candidatus Endonucleobacter sp. (ex Gigantidas childressi)]
MLKTLSTRIALERPKTVYAAILFLVLACTAMIPFLNIDTDPENMLSENDPARIFHNEVKQQFVMPDMIVVGAVNEKSIYNLQSLKALNILSEQILNLDGVIKQDQMALNTVDNITQQGLGTLRFEWLMKEAPTTQAQVDAVRNAVKRLPMLNNTLVSGDGKAAAIYVPITAKDISYRTAESIRALTRTLDSHDQYFITGLPVAEDQFGVEMFVQMGIAAPLAGLAIFLLMWFFFRSIPLVIAPMIVAMSTVLIVMGLLIGMGFTVHIMSSMIAIFLMPIAVVDSTHILSEFADRFRPGEDPKKIISSVMKHLFTPMLYTSITSSVGFLSLMLTPIPPVKVFGAFIGLGITLAFLLTILFIPAYISRMKPEALASMQAAMHRLDDGGLLGRWLPKLGRLTIGSPYVILLAFSGLFAVSVIGVTKIQINDNPVNWFKANHEIRVADKVMNEHFAGTYDAWLVLKNNANHNVMNSFLKAYHSIIAEVDSDNIDPMHFEELLPKLENHNLSSYLSQLANRLDDRIFDSDNKDSLWLEKLLTLTEKTQESLRVFQNPAVLKWMASLQQSLVDSGLVGKVNGLPDIVKTVNRELHSGASTDFRLPATANGIAQTLLQYQSSHRPQDLWHFVTPDYRRSLMWLQLTSGDNHHMSQVVDFVDNYISDNPLPEGLTLGWAGKAYLNIVWQNAMVNGMIDSLLSSFAAVFLIMILLFRSVKYGVLAMLPLTFTITFIYGLIGFIGKDYDMPIAVLSALTLGLSVDFAIHFLERVREIHRQTNSVSETMMDMFQEPGRAIARNAIVIAVGFTPLLFAPLVPYITVGIFLASIMAASAIVTLMLLPAVLTTGKSFMFKP